MRKRRSDKGTYPPCPKCHSENTRSAGSSRGKFRIFCEDCGKTTTLGSQRGGVRGQGVVPTGFSLTRELVQSLETVLHEHELGWSKSFLVEQLLRASLGLETDIPGKELARLKPQ